MSTASSDNRQQRRGRHLKAIPGMDGDAYAAFFQRAPVAMAVFDPASLRILAVNEMSVKLFGYTHEEFAGKSPADLTRPGDIVATQDNMQEFLRDFKNPGVIEKCYVRKDGSLFWAQTALSVLTRGRGKASVLIGTLIDITDRKNAERALRRKVEELEKLLHIVPAAVWVASDAACSVITGNAQANRLAEALTQENVSPSAIPAVRGFRNASDGRELSYAELPMQVAAATNREVRDAEIQMLLPSGACTTIFGNAVPIRDEHGHAIGSVGAFQDISERKKAEEARRVHEMEGARWEKMETIRQMQVASVTAGLFAHNVNQPLGAVVCYLDAMLIARQAPGLGPEMRTQLEKCKAEALRAGDTVRELIGILGAGSTPGESIDLGQEIREAVDIVRARDFAQVKFQVRLAGGLPHIWARRVDVQQALLNVLLNRAEALRQAEVASPEVTIAAGCEAGAKTVHVTIRDNGPGVDRQTSDDMFKPFSAASANGARVWLSFSRLLMEANGGELWHDPEEGVGSAFHLTLPATGA